MSREAMQLALEALESKYIVNCGAWRVQQDQAITALRQALVDADDTSQERVDEIVKTEHDKQIEIALAYQRGWDAALAQQEPVAWISEGGDVSRSKRYMDEMGFKCNPLYTAPPKRELTCVCGAVWEGETMVHPPRKREWVGLTHPQIHELDWPDGVSFEDILLFVRAIEQALKEKNHG